MMGTTFSGASEVMCVKEYSHPSKADWITAHAKATGLNLVEVDRLWLRFQQLGCNANGELGNSVFDRPLATEDVLAKNMLTAFGIQHDQDITFEQFLQIMSQASTSTLDNKIKEIFYLLNGGRNISKDLLVRILTRLFTEGTESQKDIAQMTQHFMQLMDPDNVGYIDKERFVRSMSTIPRDSLSSVLTFSILPDDSFISQGTISPSPPMGTPPSSHPEQEIPTDEDLSTIASLIYRLDWRLLANKLGFLEDDIKPFERLHSEDNEQKVTHMLKTWRERDGQNAYSEVLKKALEDCNMSDAAATLST